MDYWTQEKKRGDHGKEKGNSEKGRGKNSTLGEKKEHKEVPSDKKSASIVKSRGE